MQRAAASSPTTSPSVPSEPSSKRQRLGDGSPATPSADAQAVHDALAAEELKRTQALERQAADAGETKWVLSFKDQQPIAAHTPMRIVTAGYSTIDSAGGAHTDTADDDESETMRPGLPGRRSFGKFNRAIEVRLNRAITAGCVTHRKQRQQNPDLSSSSGSDSDSESESDEDDDLDYGDDPAGALISESRKEAAEKARAERKAKRKAAKAESLRLAAERRSKEVKLNTNGRISTGGRESQGSPDITCFQCGQKGHRKQNCPRSNGQRQKKRAPS